jgi:hypothetical protein
MAHAAFFHVMQAFHNLNAHEATLVFTSTSTYLLVFFFSSCRSLRNIFLGSKRLHLNGKAHKPLRFLFQLCRFLFGLYLIARLVPLASRGCRKREFNPFQTELGSDISATCTLESFK